MEARSRRRCWQRQSWSRSTDLDCEMWRRQASTIHHKTRTSSANTVKLYSSAQTALGLLNTHRMQVTAFKTTYASALVIQKAKLLLG